MITRHSFFYRSVFIVLLVLMTLSHSRASTQVNQDIDDLLACQLKVAQLRWDNQLWPEQNKTAKPQLFDVIPRQQLIHRIEGVYQMERALKAEYAIEITPQMLQREMNRFAQNTQSPQILSRYFKVLDNDANKIAQCLARPLLVKRYLKKAYKVAHPEIAKEKQDKINYLSFDQWWGKQQNQWSAEPFATEQYRFELPEINKQNTQSKRDFDHLKVGKLEAGSWDTSHLPIPRSRHIAVWTGSEMLVWGGYSPAAYPAVGERYNPVIDEWSSMSGINQPLPNGYQTGVWTGSKLIVWGGNDTFEGAVYDPVSDAWQAMSTTNAPEIVRNHTAVWSGSEMIVWGGLDAQDNELNVGGKFDPVNNVWNITSLQSAPVKRAGHSSVWADSVMFVWGGLDENGNYLNTGALYDPVSDVWTSSGIDAATPGPRFGSVMVWTGSEVIVWGGLGPSGRANNGARFNPQSNSWTQVNSDGPTAGYRHTAIWTGEKMIVLGGDTSQSLGGIYDPITDNWSFLSKPDYLPSSQIEHSVVWTGSEMIVFGGHNANTVNSTNVGARYIPQTETWVATSTGNQAPYRKNNTAIWTGNEMIVWGGDLGSEWVDVGSAYDPVLDQWRFVNSMGAPARRRDHTAVWTGTKMLIWGVWSDGELNTGALYDPLIDSWVGMTTLLAPVQRSSHTAIWSGDEMIIWGGIKDQEVRADGGRYNPLTNSWKTVSNQNAPSERVSYCTTWAGSEMLVWGGNNGNDLNDGRKYSPQTDSWDNISMTGSPSPRSECTAIWMGDKVLFWGGKDWHHTLVSGGLYNPVADTWSATSTINASTHDDASVVWTGKDMLVWNGGGSSPGVYFAEVSIYNPTTDVWKTNPDVSSYAQSRSPNAVWTGSRMLSWGGSPGSVSDPIRLQTMAIYSPYSSYFIGGTVTGLQAGNSLIIKNGNSSQQISSNGLYVFDEAVIDARDYQVSVEQQPTSPSQTCVISNPSGTIAGEDVTNIDINCTTNSFQVQVKVTGLVPTNQLTLQNNSGDDLQINGNGLWTFSQSLLDLSHYQVSLLSAPVAPAQSCTLQQQEGNLAGENSMVFLDCHAELQTQTDTYTLLEDGSLIANDVDGSATIPTTDDGVLANDTQINGLSLSVVNPGAFSAEGIGGMLTIAADGSFTYSPPQDQYGVASLQIEVTDGIAPSLSQILIDVQPVNDPPVFVSGSSVNSQEELSHTELWASQIVSGPANESEQQLDFVLNYTLTSGDLDFLIPPQIDSNGYLYYLPVTNTFGSVDVEVVLQDDGGVSHGGVDSSSPLTFTLNVAPVNDPPSFTVGENVINPPATTGIQQFNQWASDIVAGPANESSQSLSFTTQIRSGSDPILNSVDVDPTGNLSFDLNGSSGTASIDVSLSDDGGGDDTSATQRFDIIVQSQGDLRISLDNNQNYFPVDEEIHYNLLVENAGGIDIGATQVEISLPDNGYVYSYVSTFRFQTIAWTCTAAGGATCTNFDEGYIHQGDTFAIDVDPMPAGSSISYDIPLTYRSNDNSGEPVLTFKAEILVPDNVHEATPANNVAFETDPVAIFADGSE